MSEIIERRKHNRLRPLSVGERFGKWTVTGATAPRIKGSIAYVCQCDCGTERAVTGHSLVGRRSRSCGCKRFENGAEIARQARERRAIRENEKRLERERTGRRRKASSEAWAYRIWKSMIAQKDRAVCDRWRTYENFWEDTEPWKCSRKCRRLRVRMESERGYRKILEEQRNRCPVCVRKFSRSLRPNVDHCHKLGHVRGVLCSACNTALGQLNDDPSRCARAIRYLMRDQDAQITARTPIFQHHQTVPMQKTFKLLDFLAKTA